MSNVYKNTNRTVAKLDEVLAELDAVADEIAGRAEANLAAHRDDGEHRITRTRGRVDRFVNLDGPAAESVEFGHFTPDGRRVPGLRILRDAAGL